MHRLEMSDQLWETLLEWRRRRAPGVDDGSVAHRLYGALAGSRGRFVLAQVGQSLDGRVATPTGDARDISGPEGLRHLHRCRALMDAVIVGSSTVAMDNPRLSVREVTGPDPVRVVIDCRGALDGTQRLFSDGGAPVIVFQSTDAPRRAYGEAEVIRLPAGADGLDAAAILDVLAERGLDHVLVEGGARTIARFVERGMVDRLHVTVSPLIIGSGPTGLVLPPIDRLSSALRPPVEVYGLEGDVLFDCALRSARAAEAERPFAGAEAG